MSGMDARLAALLRSRADAGIIFCARIFGQAAVMRIDPDSLRIDDKNMCMLAQAGRGDYNVIANHLHLTECDETNFGFVGDFEFKNGETTTADMTEPYREALRGYQAKHRVPA